MTVLALLLSQKCEKENIFVNATPVSKTQSLLSLKKKDHPALRPSLSPQTSHFVEFVEEDVAKTIPPKATIASTKWCFKTLLTGWISTTASNPTVPTM